MKYLWKIGGEAGFGIMTTGLSFSFIASRSGYHVFDYTEYPSLIRGGHNTYEVVFSEHNVSSSKWEIDFLVCLNKETYDLHKHRLTDSSTVIYDADEFEISEGKYTKIHVPFKALKKEHTIMQVMVNTIALGASLAIMGGDLQLFYKIIEHEFKHKGDQVIEFNKKLAKIGFEYVKKHYPQDIHKTLVQKKASEQLVLTGNDAFSMASVAADCRMFIAYPMTPASTVLSTLAGWQEKTGMVVRHAEDEISVINTALGSSFAGVRSAVGSSGGGFALMVEALSYAGVAELPIVVFLAQRPGPATGMPTWTEQGDLLFACHAGHGEFPKIVLAPGDVQEMFELSTIAYDLADVYQTPVLVLSDKFLSESHTDISKEKVEAYYSAYKPNYGKKTTHTNTKGKKYLRYKESPTDGISERLIPGQKGIFYQANSYEHVEDGHTSERAEVRIQQVEKRRRKIEIYLGLQGKKQEGEEYLHFPLPHVFGNIKDATVVFVSWGPNKGPITDAQAILQEESIVTAYVHFTHVYPMNQKMIQAFFDKELKGKRLILVENNSEAQFGQLLRQQTGITIKDTILKYDGRPFYPEEIAENIKNMMLIIKHFTQ